MTVGPREALLLTGCVDPGRTPFLKVRDVGHRLAEYEASIARWIDESDFRSIVFCENSAYEHSYAPLIEKAEAVGKRLEVLVFKGNEGAQIYGKGYGEGEIIEHALGHSELLAQSASFYKATGRVFVKNVNSILAKDAAKPTVFILFTSWKYADTRFFKSDVGFFRENLIDAYKEVRDKEKISIERVYRQKLRGKRVPPFSEYPNIVGLCASSGSAYDLSPVRLAKSGALLKLGLYRV
jgi:hypothetical protein